MLSDFSDASRAVQRGLGRALFIEVADVAGVAEVRRQRATWIFTMMTVALGAEGGALHERMEELAPVAPENGLDLMVAKFSKISGAVEMMKGSAVRADVVGEIVQLSFGTAVFGVVSSLALAT